MNRLRRASTVIGLSLAVVVGSGIAASAAFSDTTSVQQSITAGTVAAPASMRIDDYCSTTTSSYWNGTTTVYTTNYWYNATITWPASTTTRGVTGYRVMAHLNNGQSVLMEQTTATTRTVSARVERAYLNYSPRISIITLTSYGWTAETPRSAVLAC
ncbi:hypothetical protein GCU60_19685 [Blastococcus saxobsidens]|uniref:Secreted protein n=1 Tax=Blastococcus saxobsidens TaxID=138336 RepID=A0A6L9W7A8_9ACTN|nr:hypothetical protein [Blastococcus saxobsidens]NEK87963.1 hypothetical protein [Blastococcus saxobsidens]